MQGILKLQDTQWLVQTRWFEYFNNLHKPTYLVESSLIEESEFEDGLLVEFDVIAVAGTKRAHLLKPDDSFSWQML